MMMVNSKTGKGIFVEIFTAKLVPMAACFFFFQGRGQLGNVFIVRGNFRCFRKGHLFVARYRRRMAGGMLRRIVEAERG